jgi:hypothetical protein
MLGLRFTAQPAAIGKKQKPQLVQKLIEQKR